LSIHSSCASAEQQKKNGSESIKRTARAMHDDLLQKLARKVSIALMCRMDVHPAVEDARTRDGCRAL
jgi:hypothetical protein